MNLIIDPAVQIVEHGSDGYSATFHNLFFIVSIAIEEDGKTWLHGSVSRRDGSMPSYGDLIQLKNRCIGEHHTALQVFPPREKHIDIGSKFGKEILHLWCCLDGDVTPDFTHGGNSI